MKKKFFVNFSLAFFCSITAFSQAFNISSGNWSNPLIWNAGSVPASSDHVVLYHDVVVDVNVSCQSLTVNGNTLIVNPGVHLQLLAPPVVLGADADIWSSGSHSSISFLEANNKRLAFISYKNSGNPSGVHEYFATDENDIVYKIQQPGADSYSLDIFRTSVCLKPQGDIIAIHRLASFAGDSILVLLNRGHTNYWQVISRKPSNNFWLDYTGGGSSAVKLFSTKTGRLVMISSLKIAVSDDNGLNWTERNLPSTFVNQVGDNMKLSPFGARQFITGSNRLLYSDDNFSTVATINLPSNVYVQSRLLKLADSRLIFQSSATGTAFSYYQSINNGLNWSQMLLPISYDSIPVVNQTYFANPGGNTLRVRGRYTPCRSYYTIDVTPGQSQFSFYRRNYSNCPGSFTPDYYTLSCQREDGRIYYGYTFNGGSFTITGIHRDY